jgi:hypothetical protein
VKNKGWKLVEKGKMSEEAGKTGRVDKKKDKSLKLNGLAKDH